MRIKSYTLLFALLVCACNYPSTKPVQTTSTPPSLIVATRNAPVISPTPAQVLYLPALPNASSTQTVACTQHSAAIDITASQTELTVGDSVTISLTLNNTGCAMLGLPKYYLVSGAGLPTSLFEPAAPEPVFHSIGIDPGGSDSAAFIVRAASPGDVPLYGTASFEVHLGYPGPAYWATAASQPLNFHVSP